MPAACIAAAGSETCTAAYPTAALTATAHTITASVASDTNYISASGTGTLTVTKVAPAISVTSPTISYGTKDFQLRARGHFTAAWPDERR